MGNKSGRISPTDDSNSQLDQPKLDKDNLGPEDGPEDLDPANFRHAELTNDDLELVKDYKNIISESDEKRRAEQAVLSRFTVADLLGKTAEEMGNSFKTLLSRRTTIENVDDIKSTLLPTIPLVGETVNKLFDIGIFIGKRRLERSTAFLTCLFAFTTISDMFEHLARIDKFYKTLEEGKFESQETHRLNETMEYYREFRVTIDEILAETTVMMMDQVTIEQIVSQFTKPPFDDYYCSQPDKYKLVNPTFF